MKDQESANERLLGEVVKDYVWRRRWRLMTWIAIAIVFTIGIFRAVSAVGLPTFGNQVAVVDIEGPIGKGTVASASALIPVLHTAFENDRVKVVVLEINSPGGSPAEAERIFSEIARLKAQHPKPVIAVIDELGASAAYMIAMHTDKIVAGRYSLVGSIGAILTGWDVHGLADRFEVKQQVYASGPLKDVLNPMRSPTDGEKQVLQALVDRAGSTFIQDVKDQRGKKLKRLDIFTGQVWNGSDALAIGLIDELGTLESVTHGYEKLTVNRVGPVQGKLFGASYLHELGTGIGDSLVRAFSGRWRYGD